MSPNLSIFRGNFKRGKGTHGTHEGVQKLRLDSQSTSEPLSSVQNHLRGILGKFNFHGFFINFQVKMFEFWLEKNKIKKFEKFGFRDIDCKTISRQSLHLICRLGVVGDSQVLGVTSGRSLRRKNRDYHHS